MAPCFLIGLLLLVLRPTSAMGPAHATESPFAQGEQASALAARAVASFQVKGVPVLDALLTLAQQQGFPMAIEYLDEPALTVPISVRVGPTTVSRVLGLILSHAPGYSYSLRYGVVDIRHVGSPGGGKNLLDYPLKSFDAPRESLDKISWDLEMAIDHQLHPEARGWIGDYIPSRPVVLAGPIHAQNATVRQILCQVISQATSAAWVVTVPPNHLGGTGNKVIWKILPYTHPPTRYSFLVISSFEQSSKAPPPIEHVAHPQTRP